MHPPPTEAMRFVWDWRPYQRRVLDAVDEHLSDQRLHVVAAPGAGKTSLGLEVFRRLGKPALVLAPTRTIRNQWVERLGDFLSGDGAPDWVSTDLDAPRFLTVVTYQALHTRARAQVRDDDEQEADDSTPTSGELEEVSARLAGAGVGTLVLDEAHHLRQQWWQALARLSERLGDVHVISLTGTPPYDASGREWARYEELCGPPDEQISVPELVRAGTLCAHQDFVFAVRPTPQESQEVCEHDRKVDALCRELHDDPVLSKAVAEHPWLSGAEPPSDEVFANPELAVALLAFQRSRRRRLPRALLNLLGFRPKELPALDPAAWQVVAVGLSLERLVPAPRSARPRARSAAQAAARRAARSEARVAHRGIQAVAHAAQSVGGQDRGLRRDQRRELELRGDGLRQVFLTDYVRDEGVRSAARPTLQLGAWPLFRVLVDKSESERAGIALLTGRLVVLHADHLAALAQQLGHEAVSRPIPDLEGFLEIDASRGSLVRAITELLEQGALRVLVGTRALLGEGWDAPCVNSLVLASFVGSFVTSNQMRGRAIRVDRKHPDKVASLWHLVCVEVGARSGLADLESLERRFDTFVGLSTDAATIESGIERLELPSVHRGDVEAFDREMLGRLDGLAALPGKWRAAVEGASEGRVLPTIRANPRTSFRKLFLLRTLRYVVSQASLTFVFLFAQGMRAAGQVEGRGALWLVVMFAAATAFTVSLPGFLKAAWMLWRHLPVDGSVRQIGLAVRDALQKAAFMTSGKRTRVHTARLPDGSVSLTLTGADFREQSIFAGAMAEVLGAIGDPRYLVTRRGAHPRSPAPGLPRGPEPPGNQEGTGASLPVLVASPPGPGRADLHAQPGRTPRPAHGAHARVLLGLRATRRTRGPLALIERCSERVRARFEGTARAPLRRGSWSGSRPGRSRRTGVPPAP